jgi:hypothetical protein
MENQVMILVNQKSVYIHWPKPVKIQGPVWQLAFAN